MGKPVIKCYLCKNISIPGNITMHRFVLLNFISNSQQSFFLRFPRNSEKWKQSPLLCNLNYERDNVNNLYLCEHHFENNDFTSAVVRGKITKRLKELSVPFKPEIKKNIKINTENNKGISII